MSVDVWPQSRTDGAHGSIRVGKGTIKGMDWDVCARGWTRKDGRLGAASRVCVCM